MIDEKTKNKILEEIGKLVKGKAIRLCPIDMGHLRASLQYKIEGDKVIIFTNLSYAKDMEYGKPPEKLSEEEKEDVAQWAKRHQLPAFPVIRKLETKGIEVGTAEKPFETKGKTFRPFLRPAIYQSIPEIKNIVKDILK